MSLPTSSRALSRVNYALFALPIKWRASSRRNFGNLVLPRTVSLIATEFLTAKEAGCVTRIKGEGQEERRRQMGNGRWEGASEGKGLGRVVFGGDLSFAVEDGSGKEESNAKRKGSGSHQQGLGTGAHAGDGRETCA